MLIMSRVCAEFHDKTGKRIFSVTPSTRLSFQEAPEAIQQDPLFQMLVNDGSLEVSTGTLRRRILENDPEQIPEESGKAEKTEKSVKSSRTRKPGTAVQEAAPGTDSGGSVTVDPDGGAAALQ